MLRMNHLTNQLRAFAVGVLVVAAAVSAAWSAPKIPAVPAEIDISVAPDGLSAGATAQVTVRLDPIEGIKINRYPKIKLKIPEQPGLTSGGTAEIGNDAPPPPDKMDSNYYEIVDPVSLDLVLEAGAEKGNHKLTGELKYFFCVAASGFCAPKKVSVSVPIEIH